MKKFNFSLLTVIFALIMVFALPCVLSAQNAPNAGQTVWYKQTAVVDQNAKRSGGDNTGQFIAFTKMGCYDANKEGYDVGNGFLEYKGLDNNIHVYYGNTFWGKGSYFFNSDFSRLNIRTEAGITYVYEKTAAPASAVTSAKIVKKPDPVANTSPAYIPPPSTVQTPVNPYTPSYPSTPTKIRCTTCKIPGKCKFCNGVYEKTCSNCGGTGTKLDMTYGNGYITCGTCDGKRTVKCIWCRNGICSTCNGTGYI